MSHRFFEMHKHLKFLMLFSLTRFKLYACVEYFPGSSLKDTHADYVLVSSALESGIRGSVQLLLELGLVDEAKAITEKFMARFISI